MLYEVITVKLAALRAIGQLQVAAGIQPLAEALGDDNEQLRDAATASLAQLGRSRSDEVLSAIAPRITSYNVCYTKLLRIRRATMSLSR